MISFTRALAAVPAPAPGAPKTGSTQDCTNQNGRIVCELTNPLEGNVRTFPVFLGTIIKGALGVVGSLAVLMVVWGGFLWLTSAGNSERVQQGTRTMLWAAIGVVVVFSSYLILATFTDYLTGAAK